MVIVASALFACMQAAVADQNNLNSSRGLVENSSEHLRPSLTVKKDIGGLLIFVDDETLNPCEALNDPYGSDFDWSAITSDAIFEICLLELAQNLEDVASMAQWLEGQGFSNVNTTSATTGRIWLNATWDTKRSGEEVPFYSARSFLNRLFYRGRNFAVQVVYENGRPVSTSGHYLVL